MSANARFVRWGRWLHDNPVNCHTGVGVLWRMMRGVPGGGGVQSDGGMLSRYLRAGRMMDYDMECAETHRLIGQMPELQRRLVYATYARPSHREAPLAGSKASKKMGVSEHDYWTMRRALFDWLDARKTAT